MAEQQGGLPLHTLWHTSPARPALPAIPCLRWLSDAYIACLQPGLFYAYIACLLEDSRQA